MIESPAAAPDLVIAPMRRRHLRGVVRIEQETNHRPWSQSLFAGELKLPASRNYVVALRGAVVVGFGGVMYVGDDAHLTTIAVHPAEQRNQIGSRLLLALTRCAVHDGVEAMTLEVRATNRGAQEMYRQFGYAPGGIRPQYYKDVGEDALIMWAHDLRSPLMAERLDEIQAGLRHPMRTIGLGLNAA